MKRNGWLLITLIFVCLVLFAYRTANAAEADVIILDDSCRLIKKVKPNATPKKSSFVVQYPKAAAKPASAPASASAAPKPKAKRKSILPASIRPIPADYDLNCDEAASVKPLASIFPPIEPVPYTPVPIVEDEPPLLQMTVTPLEYEITDEPAYLWAVPGLPPYIGLPVPIIRVLAPVPLVPEPETWVLLLAGFGAIGFIVNRNAKTPD